MQFIRDNKFLAILAGVFLLCVIIFIPIKMGLSTTYEERLALRQKEMDDNARNNNRPYVNEQTVERGKKSLAEIEEQAARVAVAVLEKNRRNYTPLMLVREDGTEIPAFPINRKEYDQGGLGRKYTQLYRQWIEKKIAELEPTTVPTREEVENEIKTQLTNIKAEEELRKRMESEEEAASRKSETDTRKSPVATPGLTDSGDAVRPEVSAEEKARHFGTLIAKVARADKGRIYIDINTIQLVFPAVKANPPDAELWSAEISRWVFMDVLEAIKQTNDQSLLAEGGTGVKNATVPNTAIKRLVSMAVDRNYVTPPAGTTGSPGGPGPDGMAPPPMLTDAPGASYGQPTNKQSHLSLTNRVSCQLYDVVHYNFTVVMSINHLQTLQKNLLKQNLHTILGVRIVEVAGKTTGAAVPAASAAEDLYYYGRDPIMQVTIEGELLLLTDWTRGMQDSKTRQWLPEFPPLVPVDVLKQDAMRSALRPEDTARVNEYTKR